MWLICRLICWTFSRVTPTPPFTESRYLAKVIRRRDTPSCCEKGLLMADAPASMGRGEGGAVERASCSAFRPRLSPKTPENTSFALPCARPIAYYALTREQGAFCNYLHCFQIS